MTSAVPPLLKTELGPPPIVTLGAITVSFEVPSDATVKFSISPACEPSGFFSPCFFFSGLKCPPADVNPGTSHFAF